MSTKTAFPLHYLRFPNGLRLAYIDEGVGETTLLFVHGLASTCEVWQRNVEVLRHDYRCLALDLPGYGGSDQDDVEVGMGAYAKLLGQFCVALALDAVVLVGHSMGGQVVLTSLLREHLPVTSVVLLAPAGLEVFSAWERRWLERLNQPTLLISQPAEQVRQHFRANFYRMPADARPLLERRLQLQQQPVALAAYADVVTRCVAAMLQEPVHEELPAIRLPVLLLFGEADQLIPNRYLHPLATTAGVAREGAARLPRAQLQLIPEAGHFVQWEKANEVNAAIRSFVGQRTNNARPAPQVLTRWLAALQSRRVAELLACYAPGASLHHQVLGDLSGLSLQYWWEYLLRRGQLEFQLRAQTSVADAVLIKGSLSYRIFSRPVHSAVRWTFRLQDDLIIAQIEELDTTAWLTSVAGWRGRLLGRFPAYRRHLRARTLARILRLLA
ncbi:MAG: alpha/beta fold hydrolase [Lewinella sp.]|nr:alpha/beta fold hydrolase [Lewinella sp.]